MQKTSYRSPKVMTGRMFYSQVRHAKARNAAPPTYTLPEFREWIAAQTNPSFDELYQSWLDSDYKTDKVPSVDRLDDSLSYTFDNIRLGTWASNRAHAESCNAAGEWANSNAVERLDLNTGEVLKTYPSVASVRKSGIRLHYDAIARYICGMSKGCAGYGWRYVDPAKNAEVLSKKEMYMQHELNSANATRIKTHGSMEAYLVKRKKMDHNRKISAARKPRVSLRIDVKDADTQKLIGNYKNSRELREQHPHLKAHQVAKALLYKRGSCLGNLWLRYASVDAQAEREYLEF